MRNFGPEADAFTAALDRLMAARMNVQRRTRRQRTLGTSGGRYPGRQT